MSPDFAEVIWKDFLPLIANPYFSMFFTPYLDLFALVAFGNPRLRLRFTALAALNWPKTNTRKQTYIISLLELIMPHMSDAFAPFFVNSVFPLFSECIFGSSYSADCVLSLWLKPDHTDFLSQYSKMIIPIMYRAVVSAIDHHWSPFVRQAAVKTLEMMRMMDARTVKECAREHKKHANTERSSGWPAIAREASVQHSEINLRAELRKIQKSRCQGWAS
jgi:hypothetical protein